MMPLDYSQVLKLVRVQAHRANKGKSNQSIPLAQHRILQNPPPIWKKMVKYYLYCNPVIWVIFVYKTIVQKKP